MTEVKNRDTASHETRISELVGSKSYWEGITTVLGTGTGTVDKTLTLSQGTTPLNQTIQRVKMAFTSETALTSGTGNIKLILYDGTGGDSDSTVLTGELYSLCQPDEGFPIRKNVASGRLGFRVTSGTAEASAGIVMNVLYSYE